MKVPYVIAVATLLTAALLVSSVAAGNGAPSGAHYNLNIVGVKNLDRNMPNNLGAGHVIFVGLGTKTQKVTTNIYLFNGTFDVLDKNGLDGSASFQIPANQYPTCYEVWVRALGKPGGKANITTCAYDPIADETICSVNIVQLTRERGKSGFGDFTSELTEICIDGGGCTPLFDPVYQDYFWMYDNWALKLAQLRFYPVPC